METANATAIAVQTTVNAPSEKVWKFWTEPGHIIHGNNASDDWHTPRAENDLRQGGKFNYRMESRDGKFGFDFAGEYNDVKEKQLIEYTMGDGRKVNIRFTDKGHETLVEETFEAEDQNSIQMQRDGWQAILNNFKNHVEKA